MENNKEDLLSRTREELISLMQEEGFRGFRGKQIFNWIYKKGILSPGKMKNLSQKVIRVLEENYRISGLQMIKRLSSADGTVKYLWQTEDAQTIESVYLPVPKEGRQSVCISSQIGCRLGCRFCATGASGYIRDLSAGEIVGQVLRIQRDISKDSFGSPRLSNVVFMGMGEPLQVLDNVLQAINILNDSQGMNISRRRFTISTAGIVPEIRRLARLDDQVGLAISLNAPDNELRSKMMPVNRKYPLEELLAAGKDYTSSTGRRITFEYILIRGLNDSRTEARKLVDLLQGFLCHVNLIPANPVPEYGLERPEKERIEAFRIQLSRAGVPVTVRKERGTDIQAACGQLRTNEAGRD